MGLAFCRLSQSALADHEPQTRAPKGPLRLRSGKAKLMAPA